MRLRRMATRKGGVSRYHDWRQQRRTELRRSGALVKPLIVHRDEGCYQTRNVEHAKRGGIRSGARCHEVHEVANELVGLSEDLRERIGSFILSSGDEIVEFALYDRL